MTMDGRAWAGVAAGTAGAVAGVAAAAGGQPLAGAVATVACVGCAAALLLAHRSATSQLRAAVAAVAAVEEEHPGGVPDSATGTARSEAGSVTGEEPDDLGPDSVVDHDSGLLDNRIFTVTFERKLAAARRHLRPLSLVLIDIGPGLPTDPEFRRRALGRWGAMVTSTLRESDVACRVDATTFGVILEDTPEPGAVWVAERLQIAASCSAGLDPGPVRAAAATYPNHGLRADALLAQAWAALHRAREQSSGGGPGRLGRVEVPSPEQ
jgi:GGDEF domain-containing protein